jgi:large subunit ribosomal protein L6
MREIKVVVPENVELIINGMEITAKGPRGEVKKRFKVRGLKVWVDENREVHVEAAEKACINTMKKHILNMIKGVTEGFQKKMVARYVHFPIKLKVEGNRLVIENFLGERKPRYAKIMPGVTVKVKGQELIIEGNDIEAVHQTAANIRQATKIRNKDFRVFQDGIYEVMS